jgi:hypothetical protein
MSVEDVGVISVILLVTAVVLIVAAFIGVNIVNNMLTTNIIAANPQVSSMLAKQTATFYKYDWLFFGVFLGLVLGLIIASWFISGNPLFMMIYFIIICIFVVCSFMISNTYETFSTNTAIMGTVAHFPITNFIMLNLPYILSVVGMISLVIMFGKPSFEGGGGF